MKKQINEIKRMQLLAGLITESEYQESIIGEESDTIIPKSLVTRYANMRSLFGDKAKDPSVISKLIPIITDFFPKNLDISYQELVNKFGEETANQVQTVLFGAYLDGYLDQFQKPITRLNNERDAMYPDYIGERNKVDESNINKNILNKAKIFIKKNTPAGNADQNETFNFPLEDVDPEIVDYLNSNKRLDTTVNNQSTIMYIIDDEVVVEFGY
jgi:hypothetical protein